MLLGEGELEGKRIISKEGFAELIKPNAVSYTHLDVYKRQVHNYLYGAYSGKAVVIANLVPALTTGMAVKGRSDNQHD